jgi:hypothetical protein
MRDEDKPNIVALPTPDPEFADPDKILEECKGMFETVVVFGHDLDTGVLKCYNNTGSTAYTNLMLDQLKLYLIESTFEEEDE